MTKNLEQIETEWKRISLLIPKEKYKQLKKICMELDVTGVTSLEEINFYNKLLQLSKKTIGSPTILNKKLQQLYLAKLNLLGIDSSNLKNIIQKKAKVVLSTATFGICDAQYLSTCVSEEDIGLAITKGERLFFSTGSDGVFNIQVRLVNLNYPIFSKKESSFFVDYSELYRINLPTGQLVLTDYLSCEPQFKIDLPKGQYRLCVNVYEDPNKDEDPSYYFCLAPIDLDEPITENSTQIPTIGS